MKATKTSPETKRQSEPARARKAKAGTNGAPGRGAKVGKAGRSHRQTRRDHDAEGVATDRKDALELLRRHGVDPDGPVAGALLNDYTAKKWQAEEKRPAKVALGYINTILCKTSLPEGSLARETVVRCRDQLGEIVKNTSQFNPDKQKPHAGTPNAPLFFACLLTAWTDWPSEVLATLLWIKGAEPGKWSTLKHRVSQYWSAHDFAKIRAEERVAREARRQSAEAENPQSV